MRKLTTVFLVVALGLSVAACSQMKRLTGQTDDTVLPGAREDILPPEAQTARDPEVTGDKATECKTDDPDCIAPVDQEASTAQ